MSPLQRSKSALEASGYLVEIVEHWNSFARLRFDLWGFADLLAIREGEVLAVQVTSRSNIAARVAKITDSPKLPVVRKAGIRIRVDGWGKMANGRYACRSVDLS